MLFRCQRAPLHGCMLCINQNKESPDGHVVEKENKFLFVRFDGLRMSAIKISAMTHQKMWEVSTLSCQEYLAQ